MGVAIINFIPFLVIVLVFGLLLLGVVVARLWLLVPAFSLFKIPIFMVLGINGLDALGYVICVVEKHLRFNIYFANVPL